MDHGCGVDRPPVAFSRLEPIASVIGMAADFATMDIGESNDDVFIDVASKISLSFGKNITSKTFMQGLSKAMDAVSDPKRYGEDYVKSMAGSIIPNIIASTARATDDELKEISTLGESIRSRIPFISKQLPPRRNIWGEPIIKTATGLEAFLSPVQVSKESESDVDRELARLELSLSMPRNQMTHRGEKIELDPKVYDKYVESVGKELKTILTNRIKSPVYKKLTDEKKAENIENFYSRVKKKHRARAIMTQLQKSTAEEVIARSSVLSGAKTGSGVKDEIVRLKKIIKNFEEAGDKVSAAKYKKQLDKYMKAE